MNHIKNSLIGFGGLSLLVGAVAFVTPRATQGGRRPRRPAETGQRRQHADRSNQQPGRRARAGARRR